MIKKAILISALSLVLIPSTSPAFAESAEEAGRRVMKQVWDQNRLYETRVAEIKMIISDKEGKTRERFFNLWKKYYGEIQDRSLIKFFRPASVKGMSLLSKSIDTQTTHQWIYLSAFKSTKKLSSQDKQDSFMGSDYTYADVAGRQLDQDNHSLIKESEKSYYIESIPKDSEDAYSKIRYVIDKARLVTTMAIYYDAEGAKLKTLKNNKFFQHKELYVATDAVMSNHQSGGNTQLLINDIKVGAPIEDSKLGMKGLKE